ncbi:M14 family metallopeptidase [Paenibacillus gansuensis]|uniref:M14 family metallocarboxypeptidase n=1 Tax=Paenibacillus gansuensis TaxID=306542 RepID=A0ABW5PD64_9BACL
MGLIRTDRPYGYQECMLDLRRLTRRYAFMKVETIGHSALGRPIPAVSIGEGPLKVQFNGSFHANEWITTLLLMKFAEDYAEGVQSGQHLEGVPAVRLTKESTLFIVPMVNPDGVELAVRGLPFDHPRFHQLLAWNNGSTDFSGWKANANGVDLNDQFPANWEAECARRAVNKPGPRDYGGTAPLTEPEAKAMEAFTDAHRFDRVFAFHTQGKEIYWNYRGLEPPESAPLVKEFALASGYQPVSLSDSDAGFKDWFIQKYRRPGFTVEAGYGSNPLPIEQFDPIYDEVLGLMLRALEP